MTITYTWKITELHTQNSDNAQDVVVLTRWKKTGVDEKGNTGMFAGATPFKLPEVNSENFIPLNDLKEENVLEWIKSVVVGHYAIHVDKVIAEGIAKNAIVKQPLPWEPSSDDSSIDIAPPNAISPLQAN